MADLLGAFSLAGDLAIGMQAGHGARSCYIGMHIAQELGLSLDQRTDLYYAELLKDAGCTAWTSQVATFWLVDEIAAKRELQYFRNSRSPLDLTSWLVRYVAVGAPFPTRATRIMDFLVNGRELMREGFEGTCLMATRIAQRLGMSQAVQKALLQIFEQWDGSGMPQGSRGDAVPIVSRIVLTTAYLEAFHRMGGREMARDLAQERRDKAFDPSVVDAFLSVGQEESFWKGLEDERVWDVVLSMEPEESPHRYIGEEMLTDVALSLADYADMKSPYMAGHSRRVGDTAERIARRMSLPERQAASIHQAALVHDIGIVAVPSFVLNKPQDKLTEAEREQVRLHPYHSQRILSKVPALEDVAEIASAHHEWMDGHGYYRGLSGPQVPLGARIIAVADRFDELSHDAPDRSALALDEAVKVMRQEAGSRLWRDALEVLLEDLSGVEQGQRQRARRQEWPAGLTDREVEVLRLVARGLNRRQAAKELFVSEGTVRSHLEHIYGKIGVSNRAAATLFAMEHALIT